MQTATLEREIQVTPDSGKKPRVVARMSDWQYLERSIHRLVCAWGRHYPDWEDKRAVSRHVWEQAECVRRLRERLTEFPGTVSNLDQPVSRKLEDLVDAVLQAPSHQDAVTGIYQVLTGALVHSYLRYVERAHPVHDAPTVAILQDIVRVKEQQRLWLRDYRRRYPHTIDSAYLAAIEARLSECGDLHDALPVDTADTAQPVGVRTDFVMTATYRTPSHGCEPLNVTPYIERDFIRGIEARRLFWAYGYFMEHGLAEDQMSWIWAAPDLPWEFNQDVSRHLWDEFRHGDFGYSRLLDFGIQPETFGRPDPSTSIDHPAPPTSLPTLTPQQLYEKVFFIGMCAETGHFPVKHEAYADFKAGGDLESAEMVLFDIIDETSHVQYAHHWLPLLSERIGIEPDAFRERGRIERDRYQKVADDRLEKLAAEPFDKNDPAYIYYQKLLRIMREKQPLTNAETCPPRLFKPM